MNRVSRREMLRVMALVTTGAALAACSPAVTPTAPAPTAAAAATAAPAAAATTAAAAAPTAAAEVPTAAEAKPVAETITLRWVTNHDASKMPNFQRVVDSWHEAHPDARVDFLNIPGGDEYYNAIKTQAVGGDQPDLFYCRSYDTQPFGSRGWIVNLDPYIDAHGIDTSDFWDAQIPHLLYEDSFYALPYDFSTMGFYYNKGLLAEMGVDAPPDDWDWDLFAEVCEKLVIVEDGRTVQWATTLEDDAWYWLGHIVANGGRFWSEDWRTCTLATDEVVECFEQFVQMREKGIFPEGGAVPQGVNAWPSGLSVMKHDGSWATQGLREQVGDNFVFDVTGMPYNPKTGMRAVSGAGGAWSVGTSTDHLDQAVLLCEHVTSTESCNVLIAEPVRSIPARRSSVDLWVQNATGAGLPPANVQIFAQQMEGKIAAEPYPTFWQDFAIVWDNRIPSILYGGGDTSVDVREQLEVVQEEVQEVIDLYWQTV